MYRIGDAQWASRSKQSGLVSWHRLSMVLKRYTAELLWVPLVIVLAYVAVMASQVGGDLVPLALTGLGLVAFTLRQRLVSGVLLGLACCVGTMPIAVTVALVVAVGLREGRQRAFNVGIPALCTFVLVQLATGRKLATVVGEYISQIDGDVGHGSVWHVAAERGLEIGHAGWLGFAGLLLALGCFAGFLRSTARTPRVGSMIAVVVLSAVLLAPALQPQAGLWVLVAVALARPYRLEVVAVAVTQTAFALTSWGWLGASADDGSSHWLLTATVLARLAVEAWILLQVIADTLWPVRDRLHTAPSAGAVQTADQPSEVTAVGKVEVDVESGWRAWRPALVSAAVAVAVTRVMFLLAAFTAQWLMTTDQIKPEFTLDIWLRWDALHFLAIADQGYVDEVANGNAAAFFPLFPLTVRWLGALGLEPLTAGMLVSLVSSFIACVYLYRLAELHGFAGRHSLLYLLLFPTAAFLVAPYTEALFLAGAIPAFYYAQRGRPWPAALFGAVAVGSRTVGLLVLVGVAFELARRAWPSRRKLLASAAAMMLATLPFWAFGYHLMQVRGSFFAFQEAQSQGWGRDFVGLVDGLIMTWNTWDGDYGANNIFTWRLEIVFAGLSLALLVWLMWRGYVGYSIYVGATLIIALGNTWYYSNPRLALAFFPFAFALAAWTKRREGMHTYVVVVLAGLASAGAVALTRGAWFF